MESPESVPNDLAGNLTEAVNGTNATERFQASNEGMAVAYGSLLLMALFPIVVGSFKSVKHVTHQKLHGKSEDVEVMTNKDAMMFPVYGSGVLLGIYLVFRFIDKDLVNVLFTVYFFVLGVFALARAVEPLLRSIVPLPTMVQYKLLLLSDEKPKPVESEDSEDKQNEKENTSTFVAAMNKLLNKSHAEADEVNVWGDVKKDYTDLVVNYSFDLYTILSVVLAAGVGVWYLLKKHWIANNLFGLAFSISGVEFLQLNSVLNGCILLGGLFFYDVFWVFGTDVMVTVAKSFEAPIKLIIPQDIPEKGIYADNFAMLGLGDIVIPGIFIALCLRIDYSLAINGAVKRVYFAAAFIAYILGLATTIGVMHYFKHAQPALLYLVPACLGIPLFVGLVRGELKTMFDYVDNLESPAPAKEEVGKKDK